MNPYIVTQFLIKQLRFQNINESLFNISLQICSKHF